ncbi:MAG: HDIG domain-containing protein [Bacteroides sp.]|nr:HDIG domain-containing protein [Prevotella sp.]MCM1407418.1 HDIG domain-containing protein [Treponema brennaborense]MCM1469908.1 HDIG domain-containing protein [Bacteroides sp.]
MSNTDSDAMQPTALFSSVKNRLFENWKILTVFAAAFLTTLTISFFDIAGSDTVLSFPLSEFEIGQIADRTIVAVKTLPPTVENPVSIEKDEKIIRKGFPITKDDFAKLQKMSETPSYVDYRSFANSMLYLILLSAFSFFLFSPPVIGKKIPLKELIFISVLFVLLYLIVSFGIKIPSFSDPFSLPIIIPSSLFVILAALLFGTLDAVYMTLIMTLAVLYISSFDPIPALFVLASGIAAVRIVRKMEKRIDLVIASLMLALLDAVFMLALCVIFSSEHHSFSPLYAAGIAFNGFISGILALGFMTPLEPILNTASVFRLMDLSDLNSPIMKRMLLTASGTYNHSMLVATLAESACSDIGANPLLARVGAYYHDLGKMEQPEYFVENQAGGNKHDEINPRLSVSVIRRHVKKGVEKAHQMHFPQEVIDIIAQHHGNSVISYFYNEAKKLDENTSPEEYSYIGDLPSSREAAVVMLADTVEAACRTLDKPSVSRLEKFIRQLIMAKYEHGQLDGSGLTFRDINTIQASFVTILAGYYHSRIEYPNQKDPDELPPADSAKAAENHIPEKNADAADAPETEESRNAKKTRAEKDAE